MSILHSKTITEKLMKILILALILTGALSTIASAEVTIENVYGDSIKVSNNDIANALSRLNAGRITIEQVKGGNSDGSINLIGIKAEYRGDFFEVIGWENSADEICRQKGFERGSATHEDSSSGWGCNPAVSFDSNGDIKYHAHYCRATLDSVACRKNLKH